MNTKTMEQFALLNDDVLAEAMGGAKWDGCEMAAFAGFTVGNVIAGPWGGLGLGMVAAAAYCN